MIIFVILFNEEVENKGLYLIKKFIQKQGRFMQYIKDKLMLVEQSLFIKY